jgi:glutathione S-transferase
VLKLWGRTTSQNVQKAMWAIGELGLARERIDLGGRFGGLDMPEFLAENPNRRVPALEDDGCARLYGLLDRAAYRQHVMVPCDELTGRSDF